MARINKDQKGFTLIEGLLVVIALALVTGVGFYVINANKDKKDDTVTSASTSKTSEKTKSVADPTSDWAPYTSTSGKFSLKYPKAWATATHPELCADGIFMLGGNSASVGKCASDDFGQMTVTWRSDRAVCGDLNSDAWTQNSKETVTASGVSGTRIVATAKAPGQGLGSVPEGTATVQYCFVNNGTTYIADYTQLSTYPNVLNDFNTMVTKTLKFE